MANETIIPMTPLMMKLLNFIKKYVKKNKYYPTYQEMADALDFKSKNSVTVLITKLEQRKDLNNNYYMGYEEQLNYDLGHDK